MEIAWLGRVEYGEALSRQRAYREALIAGEVPEALWLLEHPPVVTTGRRAAGVDADRVRAAGYAIFESERGGLATCHEPGQLVGYVLARCDGGIRRLVEGLEAGIIASCAELGVPAHRREGFPGAWSAGGKLCAIGLHVRRGVTMHGFALNLVNELRGFELIVPCGLTGVGVTSVRREAGRAPTPREAAALVGRRVRGALGKSGAGPCRGVDDAHPGE